MIDTANEREHPAVVQLRDHQTQLDQDGIMVGVSRQAIDEVLALLTSPSRGETVAEGAGVLAQSEFRSALGYIINCHSKENGSDTPDFILAEYLAACLATFDATVMAREKWYGRTPQTFGTGPTPAVDPDPPKPMEHYLEAIRGRAPTQGKTEDTGERRKGERRVQGIECHEPLSRVTDRRSPPPQAQEK